MFEVGLVDFYKLAALEEVRIHTYICELTRAFQCRRSNERKLDARSINEVYVRKTLRAGRFTDGIRALDWQFSLPNCTRSRHGRKSPGRDKTTLLHSTTEQQRCTLRIIIALTESDQEGILQQDPPQLAHSLPTQSQTGCVSNPLSSLGKREEAPRSHSRAPPTEGSSQFHFDVNMSVWAQSYHMHASSSLLLSWQPHHGASSELRLFHNKALYKGAKYRYRGS